MEDNNLTTNRYAEEYDEDSISNYFSERETKRILGITTEGLRKLEEQGYLDRIYFRGKKKMKRFYFKYQVEEMLLEFEEGRHKYNAAFSKFLKEHHPEVIEEWIKSDEYKDMGFAFI